MRGERILLADDERVVRDGVRRIINEWASPQDDLQIIADAGSIAEVRALLEGGLRPTLALVDGKFIKMGDGEDVADLIKKLSPSTHVVSFSSSRQNWGNSNWKKGMSGEELARAIVDLRH